MENHKYGPMAEVKRKRKQIRPTENHEVAGAEMSDVMRTRNPGVEFGAGLQEGSESLKEGPRVVRPRIPSRRPVG
jgi:hypothetical protein